MVDKSGTGWRDCSGQASGQALHPVQSGHRWPRPHPTGAQLTAASFQSLGYRSRAEGLAPQTSMGFDQLLWSHLRRAKRHVVAVVMRPVAIVEDSIRREQLLVQRCATEWREDAKEGHVNTDCVQTIGCGKYCFRSLIIEPKNEPRHNADPSIMQSRNRF